VLLGGAALLMLAVGGFSVFAFVNWINSQMRKSEGYRLAMVVVRADPQVTAAIGEPISDNGIITGNFSVKNESQTISLETPLRGPKGRATLSISATKHAGPWEYRTLSVTVAATHQTFDLRAAANNAQKRR
jgi:hypothetical protein